MKTLHYQSAEASRFQTNDYFIRHRRFENTRKEPATHSETSSKLHFDSSNRGAHRINDLFTHDTVRKMVTGQIPDLWGFCLDLAGFLSKENHPDSALSFIPLMQALEPIEKEEAEKFIQHPESRHVLASNDRIEVVLIHWKPGKASDVHGHPEGGCLFKLLYGKLEELRYTPEKSPKLLGFNSYRKGSLAYIDNQMAFHQVGNPYGTAAVSLHIYLK